MMKSRSKTKSQCGRGKMKRLIFNTSKKDIRHKWNFFILLQSLKFCKEIYNGKYCNVAARERLSVVLMNHLVGAGQLNSNFAKLEIFVAL